MQLSKAVPLAPEPPTRFATDPLFVYVHCLIDDAIKTGALAIALVRHLRGRRSESGFLAEIRFPQLPPQPEVNRRIRWLWGAREQLRAMLVALWGSITGLGLAGLAGWDHR